MKSSRYLYRLTFGCRVVPSCAIAWGGESLIPVKEEEIGKVFTLVRKVHAPISCCEYVDGSGNISAKWGSQNFILDLLLICAIV